MIRVAVLSDTHDSRGYIQQTLETLQASNWDQVWHLGDYYKDTQPFIDAGYQMERIPGTWGPEYQDYAIDNRITVEVEGWSFFLTHTPKAHFMDPDDSIDPSKVLTDQSHDFFLHGHTHHPRIEATGKTTILNPGHLKENDDRGYDPSYAQLHITPNEVEITIIGLLDQKVFQKETITR